MTCKLLSDKIEVLKQNLPAQKSIFINQSRPNESIVKASFYVALTVAIAGKPLTDVEIVKEYILQTIEEVCPNKLSLFAAISLSANTIAHDIP